MIILKHRLSTLSNSLPKALLFCLFFCFGIQTIWSQVPKITSVRNGNTRSFLSCATRSAGTVSFGPVIGQSNNGAPDTIFLCYGDQIYIQHNKDGDINTGDPDPSSPAARGYLLYSCPPTISGDNFAAIDADCNLANPAPPPGTFWYVMGEPNGDINLVNDGVINDFFNNGDPFLLYLAPATFDYYTLNTNGEYEGGYDNSGSCIKVSTAAAFPVVYLNKIELTNFTTNSPTSFAGNFVLEGGYPEFNPAAHYTVTMALASNPNIKANLFNDPYSHGKVVQFAAPSAGTYIITVTDGYSCTFTQRVTLPYSEVQLAVSSAMVTMGDEVCLDVTVGNWNKIVAAQFSINFDPNNLEYTRIDLTSNPLNLNAASNFGTTNVDQGEIRFIWADPLGNSRTLPDNTVLFRICFKAKGLPGTMTDVKITDKPINIEVINEDNFELTPVIRNGTVKIINPTQLILDIKVCSTTGSSGRITVTAYGPESQYNYYFNGNPLPQVINQGVPRIESGLAPGIYTIRVENASQSESITLPVQVVNAAAIDLAPIILDPSCSYNDDGTITLNPSGGQPPYTLEWSTFEFNKNAIGNLSNGFYTVKVTDALGCSESDTFRLSKSAIAVLPPTLIYPACSGVENGSITAQAVGGTPFSGNTYNYRWSNGVTQNNVNTSTISGLKDGEYRLTITDSNGCTATLSFTLPAGKVINATESITNTTCYNYSDGAIVISATTDNLPTGPYTFIWEAAAGTPMNTATTSSVNNLPQGMYSVTISDVNNCSIVRTYQVGGYGEIKLQSFNKIDDNCSGNPSGSITILVNGEAVPFIGNPNNYYKFTWSDGSSNHNVDAANLQLTNLSGSAGQGKAYYITITDANGCTADTVFYISKKDAPLITFDTIKSIACQGGSGGEISATIKAIGGNQITSVTWSSNAGTPVQSGDPANTITSVISNLSGGTYIVTVSTNNGCEITDTVVLEGAGTLSATEVITAASCAGINDGAITLNVSGGSPPYQYNWSNGGADSPTQTNLSGGTYTVSVTDGSGCPAYVKTYTIPVNPSIISNIDVTSIRPSTCYDATIGDGQATVSASGGNANAYTFIWSSGETNSGTSSSATMLNGGMQYVTISDGICTVIDSVLIPSTPAIAIDRNASTITDVTCFGDADGSINVIANGGNGSFQYSWNPSATGSSLNNLSEGVYYLTITDAKNCILRDSFKINEPDFFVAEIDSSQTNNISCAGENDGQISLQVTGGNAGNITYDWTPSIVINQASASNLSAGNYQIIVTDSKGCQSTVNTIISEPTPIVVNWGPISEPQCAGYKTTFDITSISGGAGPGYTYTIDNGSRINVFVPSEIYAGSHTLTVYDENGCTTTEQFTVSEPAPILINLPDEVTVNLGDSVQISPEISSVFPIDVISWTPSEVVNCTTCDAPFITATNDLYVVVRVQDVNGCYSTDSTLVLVDKRRKVYMPTVFTPNRDGVNDKFQIYTGPGVKNINFFRIFDRWGACVYSENNIPPNENGTARGWDGWFNGKECNPGVYTYVAKIEFEDNAIQTYFGSITLIR